MVGSDRRYWNGTVTIGGGSGAAYSDYIVSSFHSLHSGLHLLSKDIQAAPIEAISMRARRSGIRVDHVLHDDPIQFPAINDIARQSEVCLVFVSVFNFEGWDRSHLRLDHEGEKLIKAVERGCAGEAVVVLHIGGQVIMEDWVG